MIQFELDYIRDFHQHWLRDKRFGCRADFTGSKLENLNMSYCDFTGAIFDDTRIFSCDLSNANLTNIVANRVTIMNCDLSYTNLKNAHLSQAKYAENTFVRTDLWNVTGDGTYIISLQLGGHHVCYTSEILQVNCLQFDIKEIWWMSDDEVLSWITEHTDEEKAALTEWWTKWKLQIYQIVTNHPAKPQNKL